MGAVLGPAAFGVVAGHVSYLAAWSMVGVGALFSAAIFVLVRRFADSVQDRPRPLPGTKRATT